MQRKGSVNIFPTVAEDSKGYTSQNFLTYHEDKYTFLPRSLDGFPLLLLTGYLIIPSEGFG
ncbi:MAG: hypothetical protein JRF69_02155 [Deltaproteobacteria bacterium]|nr:hypothetical protein [Deltaproteobacteria bacterium]